VSPPGRSIRRTLPRCGLAALLDPTAALAVDAGVNGPMPGGRNTQELHAAQIDLYERRRCGSDATQRGIEDVDIGHIELATQPYVFPQLRMRA
jgi:hypothetical protein